jgi:hypothetical protein
VYFVRDYTESGPSRAAATRRLILNVSTRLFGRADMTIWFDRVVSGKESVNALLGENGRPQEGAGQ